MEYAEYKQLLDTLAILQEIECSEFVKDYNETYDRFTYSHDIRVFMISCELGKYNLSVDDFNKLLFTCKYYLNSPEEWDALQETFAGVVE